MGTGAGYQASARGKAVSEKIVGKWQTARKKHECNGCVELIEIGEPYLRAVDIAELKGYDPKDHADVWDAIAAQRLPLQKYHELCWLRERQKGRSLSKVS